MAERLRAAVIGCGWIGSEVADDPLALGIQAHAAAYEACTDTRLAGVCDADSARADRAARRWGLTRGMNSVAELLAEVRPEIVSVCTPDATHRQVLREVLDCDSVRAIIAEKPLALDVAEAEAIVTTAARRNIVLAVNYIRRFAPSHIAAQARIAAGEIGQIMAVQGLYTKGVAHNGSHWFDLARWLVGDIVRVRAWPGVTDPSLTDPTCHVHMVFAGGQSGVLLGLDADRFTVFEMDILGSKGRLRVTDSGMHLEWLDVGPSPHYSGYRILRTQQQMAGSFQDATLRLVEDTIAALTIGSRPRCGAEDGLAAITIAAAARTSLSTGSDIEVRNSFSSVKADQ